MKRKALLIISLIFFSAASFLIYLLFEGVLNKGQTLITILLAVGGGLYPAWEFFKSYKEYPAKASYDLHKDLIIIYTNSDHFIELRKDQIKTITFESDYSLRLVFELLSNEKFTLMPPGFGLKAISEIEEWFGHFITNKSSNIPFKRFSYYKNFLNLKRSPKRE